MAMPMLRFEGGPGEGMTAWTGSWPPDLILLYALGKTSGGHSWTSWQTIAKQNLLLADVLRLTELHMYERVSYSELPEEIDAHPHVFRGAVYVYQGLYE